MAVQDKFLSSEQYQDAINNFLERIAGSKGERSPFLKRFTLIFLTLLLNGCIANSFGSPEYWKQTSDDTPKEQRDAQLMNLSSGYIGCPADKIAITDYKRTSKVESSWTATCNNKKFYCAISGYASSCKEELK